MWVLGVVLGLIAIALAFSYYAYRKAFYNPKGRVEDFTVLPEGEHFLSAKDKMFALMEELKKIPFEWVKITSYDGLTLYAKYYHIKDGAPLQIQFHGYRGMARRDFCGGCKLAIQAGHNVLLVDQRAHGISDGVTICFGVKEKFDVLSWVDYAINRFGKDVKIILSGVSMGAATVLESTALPLPKNVKGVIADSPYSSAEEIIAKVVKDMRLPVKLAMPFVKLGAWIFGNLRLTSGAEKAVKSATVPIMIIHGEADNFVPCEMGKRIYNSCAGSKTLLTVPNAGHGISYIVDPDTYVLQITAFIAQIL